MKKTDICYYLSVTKEENSAFIVAPNQNSVNVTDQSKTEGNRPFIGSLKNILYYINFVIMRDIL